MQWIRKNLTAVVSWVATGAMVLIAAGVLWANTGTTATSVGDHEQRLRHLEKIAPAISQLQTDVREIRRMLLDLHAR